MPNPPNNRPPVVEHGDPPAPFVRARLGDGDSWSVPAEIPVAIVYNGRNYAVMLATPADLGDFAIGFSIAENIVAGPDGIEEVSIAYRPEGADIHITLTRDRLERLDLVQRRRNIAGRAGCGLCGLDNADTFIQPLPRVRETRQRIAGNALRHALAALPGHQPLNAETRTVHAAAWVGTDGEIIDVREDVGRHNALDKLIGANMRAGRDASAGFVLMSSRCSYELVEKAARAGIGALASISAPTAFAIRKAREANITLYARTGGDFAEIG